MIETLHEYLPGTPGDSRDRIKNLLDERKMNQAILAEMTGMSESALSRYLSGHTDTITTENIIAIARVFHVSTDFLLCLTDIPFTTNYDIEKLGLSAKAAKKLLTRQLNPEVVSMLLEMPAFDLLTEKLREMRDGTIAAGVASMKAIFKKAEDILTEYARENPGDRRKMQQAISDIRAIQPASAYEVDTTSAETIFRKIMQDFRAGSKAYVGAIDKLTTEIMPRIVTSLRKQTNHPEKLRGFTPEMMTDAIMENLAPLGLSEEHMTGLRDALLPLFSQPQDLPAKKTEPTRGNLSSIPKP